MKKYLLSVFILSLALVFLIGCTPTATAPEQEDASSESQQEEDMDEIEPHDDTMEEDTMDDDMSEDEMSDDEMADEEMKDDTMTDDEMADEEMEAMSEYKDLTAEEAKELIDTTPDLVIVDVSPKYAEGHIPGAINYYIGDGSWDAAIPTLDKDVPYLVYCHVDSASIPGAQKLIDAGFPVVYRLEGNYAAWVDAGYPVETGNN